MFTEIAKLVRTRRGAMSRKTSQSELSHALGYKAGQMMSNCERALCGLPLKKVRAFCELTDTPISDVKNSYLDDCEARFDKATNALA